MENPISDHDIATSALPPARKFDWKGLLRIGLPVVLAFALGLGLGWQMWGRYATKNLPLPSFILDDDPSLGPANAKVTIVEFGDYQCPFCQIWQEQTWPALQEIYGDQIRLVYRDFPLYSIHGFAIPAAEAANCAGDQGKYWEYHGLLLSNRSGFSQGIFEEYANELSLDTAVFNECLESRKYLNEVARDFEAGQSLGVNGTPFFIINNSIKLSGMLPVEEFQRIIDTLLEQS